jgi:predicted AAA+ superfamily ATPase
LDEVQRVPGLFLPIKQMVDRNRIPGRYLLTGSANVALLPRLADALVGRMEVLTLWPLSQVELQQTGLEGYGESVVDRWFRDQGSPCLGVPQDNERLWQRILSGGYPEPLARSTKSRREAWYESYVTTILQRDIRDLSHIEGLADLPRLLSLVVARAGGLANTSELTRASGLPNTTLKRYLTLLEGTYLVQRLPAWSGNLSKRLVKAPKLFPNDTGLMAHLLHTDETRLRSAPVMRGPLLETFVLSEITKQLGWSSTRARIYHFRTHVGDEVDFVLEDSAGRCVGIEVKAAASVGPREMRGLRLLQETLGERFVRGVLLYTGQELVPFDTRLHAVPVSELWASSA